GSSKCDSLDYSCTGCSVAGHACTFDIPPGQRGPKGRPRRRNIVSVPDGTVQHHHGPLNTSSSSYVTSTVHTVETSPHPPAAISSRYPRHPTTLERYALLAGAVAHASSSLTSLEAVARECADLFFGYIVPSNMSVHEPSFRHSLNQAFGTSPPGVSLTQYAFTLITALCAKVCFFVPSDLFPIGRCLADTFLEASRSCLASFTDADYENPCADSITIRYLHSNCLHTCARPMVSWNVFGEAVRLVQRMRLHDEDSYASLPTLEADKRRNAFWQVYIGDKSLAVLRSMPITIYDYSFEEGITTTYPLSGQNECVAPGEWELPWTNVNYRLTVGSNAGIRLWRYATDLLLRMRLIKKDQTVDPNLQHQPLTPTNHTTLGELYVRFATCIDDLPPHILPNSEAFSGSHGNTTRKAFTAQIADLQVTYHCLKMHLTQKLEEIGYFSFTGECRDMLVLKKTEIAGDMIRLLQSIPFWSLHVNGEPCAEKIRLVGASLLAISQEDSSLATRARRDFKVLLDILSQLDSKASDTLRREYP
ncbi:uncharacterized protein N7479_000110, partial [Penicillium vulpinum]|uniref:uncharacterized protein n=1 Tax=Penicillium vulpinum TaxID=29845 RepID=UPI0025477729